MSGAHVITIGNEKGGSGKSTAAMHLIVALLLSGRTVASVDLDQRQGTLTRYIENRRAYAKRNDLSMPHPVHETVVPGADSHRPAATSQDEPHKSKSARRGLEYVCGLPSILRPARGGY